MHILATTSSSLDDLIEPVEPIDGSTSYRGLFTVKDSALAQHAGD